MVDECSLLALVVPSEPRQAAPRRVAAIDCRYCAHVAAAGGLCAVHNVTYSHRVVLSKHTVREWEGRGDCCVEGSTHADAQLSLSNVTSSPWPSPGLG